jgi:histidinol-phosphate/aromatic aminotransferase/cobyric acid decarboxylase-like protein
LAALSDPVYYADDSVPQLSFATNFARVSRASRGCKPVMVTRTLRFAKLDPPLDASTVVERSAARGLYVRDFPTEARLRHRALRIAVRDGARQRRLLALFADTVAETRAARAAASPVARDAEAHPVAVV